MGFKMSQACKLYFNKLAEGAQHGKFKVQFDFYYICLMAGFLSKDKTECVGGEEFVSEFPGIYIQQRRQITGLLIATEIERNKIDINNRERLEKTMLELVKPDSPTKLSSIGERYLDEYAEKGFKLIAEKIPTPPNNLDTFLTNYYERVIKKIEETDEPSFES
ncbi:MAG: hypothetical protein LBC03_06880 [Nitrososphaerota archaeon]|jgi:hypothetical protein|nr:hypothetical protein [Nitrososphaerota archaeon]